MSTGISVLDKLNQLPVGTGAVVGPVTFVSRYKDTQPGPHRVESYTDTDGTIHVFGVEGIDWIRGHHSPDSEEARALLVAWAISNHG